MLTLRQPEVKEVAELGKIYDQFYGNDFPLNFNNAFASIVAEDNNKILGFGWLDLMVEANIILKLDSPSRDKFKALFSIIDHGKQVAVNNKFDQLHVFVNDPKFAAILIKHLKFKRSKSECLVMNLGD